MKYDINDIIKEKPTWMVRNGLFLILLLICLLIILSSFLRTTQFITVPVQVMVEEQSILLSQNASIDSIYKYPGTHLEKGDTILRYFNRDESTPLYYVNSRTGVLSVQKTDEGSFKIIESEFVIGELSNSQYRKLNLQKGSKITLNFDMANNRYNSYQFSTVKFELNRTRANTCELKIFLDRPIPEDMRNQHKGVIQMKVTKGEYSLIELLGERIF